MHTTMQQRLLALALAVIGAASVPLLDQTVEPVAAPRSPIPPVVRAFYKERQNATDGCSVTLYTNKAVGPSEWLSTVTVPLSLQIFLHACTSLLPLSLSPAPAGAQCGLLHFEPELPDSLKRAVLRLHVSALAEDSPAVRRKKRYQVRLCSICDLDKCHEFAKKSMHPGERTLEVDVPKEALKSKSGLRVRISVDAKKRMSGDQGATERPCERALIQFVTNDNQSVLAPTLLLYKKSSPADLTLLLPELQTAE